MYGFFDGEKMAEVVISIPEELEELGAVPKIRWQLAVEERLREELSYIARIKGIVLKSKLTHDEAAELAESVNSSLGKRYGRLLKEGK